MSIGTKTSGIIRTATIYNFALRSCIFQRVYHGKCYLCWRVLHFSHVVESQKYMRRLRFYDMVFEWTFPLGCNTVQLLKRTAEPSPKSISCCTSPFPKERRPTIVPLSLSCKAPARISDAEAEVFHLSRHKRLRFQKFHSRLQKIL